MAKPVLGKRTTNREGSNQVEGEHVEVVKRGKRSVKYNSEELAGVLMHPCWSQCNYSVGTTKGLETLGQFEAFTS